MELSPESFTAAFEQWRPHLRTYLLRMTASAADTEDLVQDTWLRAVGRLDTLRDESSLKAWLFRIASHLAIDFLRQQKRWPEHVTDICKTATLQNPAHFQEAMQLAETSPHAQFEIREHIAFCFLCIAKSLPLEQHLCLLLKEIHDFQLREVATILQMTEALVKYHLHAARQKMADLFEARCALINQQGTCHQCTELNGIFNPKQQAQAELVKIKMVRAAGQADKARLLDLRMEVLREIDPYTSGAHALQLHHLAHNRRVMEKYLAEKD
ncbi:MAG: RNA polymerase sigma factor [Bacteroidia bacterium]|nr:RNA polymerase sigma factor [Bacteroidia bacterium]